MALFNSEIHNAPSYPKPGPQAPAVSPLNSVDEAISRMDSVIQFNNALAIDEAEKQRNWEEKMWQQNADFNASEALKNRDWQEYMSNTAHQREIADLKAAGLNPVLSAMGGNGATVTSGSTASNSVPNGSKADVDQSGAHALVSLLTAFLTNQTNLEMANLSARTNEAVAEKYTAMEKIIAEMNRENLWEQLATSRYVSDNALQGSLAVAGATVTAASMSKMATEYMADHNLQGTKYAKDMEREIAQMNNDAQLERLNDSQAWEDYMSSNYPNTFAAILNYIRQHPENFGNNPFLNPAASWDVIQEFFGIGKYGNSGSGIFNMAPYG